jgi:hypothetical protein
MPVTYLGPSFIFRRDEILNFHLLELPRAKNEIARSNLISECFAYLSNTKRHFHSSSSLDIDKIGKDSLQIDEKVQTTYTEVTIGDVNSIQTGDQEC